MGKNIKGKKNRELVQAYLLNTPVIVMAAIFILLPVAGTLVSGFMRDVTFLPSKFFTLENYSRIFDDIHFWQSAEFTLLFVIVSVMAELILGILFALLLNESIPGRGVLRVVVLIPWVIPVAISARVWQFIYNFDYGILNFLVSGLGLSSGPVNWFGSASSAFFSLVLSDVWKTTPFMTLILLAGLSAIPGELYSQSKVDGTNFLQRFYYITLPLLRPVIVVALLFRTIDAIRIFDLVYVLTGGGPGGSTTSLSLYAFRYYLSGDFGYASAISVIVFLIAGLLAVFYIRFGKFGAVAS